METVDTRDDRVRRARGGDRLAFTALVEESWVPLVALARSVLGEGEAEDAVQDALIQAWRKLPRLREPAAFPAWIRRILLHDCLRRTRLRSYRTSLNNSLQAANAARTAKGRSVAEHRDQAVDVQRILACLAPRQRAVMHLTLIEELSDREIGVLMGITAASVRSHRRRARQRARQILNGDGSP